MNATLSRFTVLISFVIFFVASQDLLALQLTVNNDLGAMSADSSFAISGDTAADPEGSEVSYYLNQSATTANWGNEIVYQFSIAQSQLFNMSSTAVGGDPDFFLLNSLAIGNDGTKNFAEGTIASFFLDGVPPGLGTPTVIDAGTYWVSATTFQGFDGATNTDDATFAVELLFETAVAPTAVDLGGIAMPGESFLIDTLNSTGLDDSEIALWDSAGRLLDSNDDAGGGVLSEIDLATGLAAGTYFVGVGEFNSTYDVGFAATSTGPTGGDYTLSFNGMSIDATLAAGSVDFFQFSVVAVPEPGMAGMLALGTVLMIVRRRR